ncbi:MAG: hypothetical protein A3J83_03690 [Elusimicrobia bacterium RIFOXYA2_FULL_40_6]|nr:MAG: hypothetical protein A3J83_03690 [Elusimicrobia bacterium RIFOXYA2_FULL_40_6]
MKKTNWRHLLICIGFVFLVCSVNAQSAEPYLNPAGCPTADVLRKNEKLLCAWGWGAYGLSDRTTLFYDWLLVFSGIPSGYLRYQLPLDTKKITHAIEVFGVYMNSGDKDFVSVTNPAFEIRQKGWDSWVHWNTTYKLTNSMRLHASAGATYDTYQRYVPKEEAQFTSEKIYENYYTPDYALGCDYSLNKSVKLSLNYSSGNGFFIADQNPQRWAMQMGIQLAPFLDSKHKFLSSMRVELWGYYVNYTELNYEEKLPVPIFPLVMWQW